jgi:hypothetical protein
VPWRRGVSSFAIWYLLGVEVRTNSPCSARLSGWAGSWLVASSVTLGRNGSAKCWDLTLSSWRGGEFGLVPHSVLLIRHHVAVELVSWRLDMWLYTVVVEQWLLTWGDLSLNNASKKSARQYYIAKVQVAV